ncbi:CIC family chloride channel protein [Natranaerovirga hydrolytica]|uniref:CIC family chloride channel protein n=1 Tax=Natranaerovirga hydrolytica TaxID=680378 RepID=A0A4R1MAN7_9FIRM|nr:chloride channel protein [Natranaerovirga hydrolytica]TCK88014.1 CIC family chloride channel protein [Natranaerovirga hydrolytica]
MKKIYGYVSWYMIKWLIVATLVGIGGGLSAVALKKSIDFIGNIGDLFPLWVAPIIGSIIVTRMYMADECSSGFGTDYYLKEVNEGKDVLKIRTLFTKLVATAATIGFKGSGGVEGPMLVMGGSVANRILKIPFLNRAFSKDDKRTLIICGAAGAIGAMFRSPLGGGIFVVEILYKSSLNYGDLFPSMLSSTMGFVAYSMIADPSPMFDIPNYLPNVYNVPFFILAAIIAAILSLIFMSVFKGVQKLFERLPDKTKAIQPILGAIITGIIIYNIPNVYGTGTNYIQEMIHTQFPIQLLVLMFIGKVLATSFTVASGGSAGLVIPALFIGAIAGNGLSALLAVGDVGLSSSLVIAGMSASLASVANVPIAAAIMLVEMVGLRLGVPATIGSIIGYILAQSKVIYGVTSPEQRQFVELQKLRQDDAQEGGH